MDDMSRSEESNYRRARSSSVFVQNTADSLVQGVEGTVHDYKVYSTKKGGIVRAS